MFLLLGVRAWSVSIEVFTRHGMGVRYPGAVAVPVLLLIPVYCLFWEGYDLVPMVWFLGLFLLMCARHRMGSLWRTFHGQAKQTHTFYTGTSVLQSLFPKQDEVALKLSTEPICVALLALVIGAAWNAPLGVYLLIGAGCNLLSSALWDYRDRTRELDVHDQVVEQRIAAERFRRGSNHWS